MDRTTVVVLEQLEGMACEAYELGILDAPRGRMLNETRDAGDVAARISWLKRMNARGHEIYIRPALSTPHALVLVDDLTRSALEQMDDAGVEPSVIVETSPENFQAWVRLSMDPVPAEVRLEVSRHLTRVFGGDVGAIGARRYGRLAGLTNRKPQHRRADGLAPFVLLWRARNERCSKAALLEQAVEIIEKSEQERPVARGQLADFSSFKSRSGSSSEIFAQALRRLLPRVGKDVSRADFAAAIYLRSLGFEATEIEAAMLEESPNLALRKKGREEEYVRRTVERAIVEADRRRIVNAR